MGARVATQREERGRKEEFSSQLSTPIGAESKLASRLREQKNAIDSLVDLLEKQKQAHTKEISGRDEEIDSLRKQLSELQMKNQAEVANGKASNEETASTLQEENAVLKADAETRNEVFLLLKNELRKALNELAQYQHEEHKS